MAKRRDDFVPEEEPLHEDVQEALGVGDDILEVITNLDRRVIDKASDFFSSVKKRTWDICATLKRTNDVSDKQRDALDNMKKAVRKWVHDDDEEED